MRVKCTKYGDISFMKSNQLICALVCIVVFGFAVTTDVQLKVTGKQNAVVLAVGVNGEEQLVKIVLEEIKAATCGKDDIERVVCRIDQKTHTVSTTVIPSTYRAEPKKTSKSQTVVFPYDSFEATFFPSDPKRAYVVAKCGGERVLEHHVPFNETNLNQL